ncbi:MAG TPA: thermonuclease family protein [Pseudonocardia sp.]|nr:thermonuclease family protein [Pseudonocardia sp.]
MELRSDIAAATTRMTSGYEVQREIRQLAAYLREGETVQRLAAGIYGAGAGLLAVTDYRVLLLRDGRSGQASEGFPLERVSAAEWTADGPLGTITVSDSNTTAELRDVPTADGAEVVGFIRSLTEPQANVPPSRRWTNFATPRGIAPAGPGATGPVAPLADNSGPSRTWPPSRAVPTQSGVERTGPGGGPSRIAAQHAGGYPTPAQYAPNSTASATADALTRGAVPISVLARTTAIPAQQLSVEQSRVEQSAEQFTVEQSRVERSVEQPWVGQSRAQHSVEQHPVEQHPVQQHSVEQSLEQSRVERSGPIGSPDVMAGEVPVSLLAAEATVSLHAAPAGEDLTGSDAEATMAVPRAGAEPTDEAVADGERPQPISWSAPAQSRGGAAPGSTESRTVNLHRPVRLEARNRPPNAEPGTGPGALARSKKWIWLGAGAAGLIGLAALGSAKLISTGEPGPASVNPAPAAVDSAVGPVVTITKVIDGDTVEVSGPVNGTVEVLGIVAPRLDKDQCGATTSKAFAVKTLNNATVTLVTDPSQPATDHGGNRLAFLRLPDGADYSVVAVEAGMARYYESPQPVGNAAAIKAAEADAEKKGAGLWAAPCHGKFSGTGTTSGSSSGTTSGSSTGTGASHASETTSVKPNSTRTSRVTSEDASTAGN